MKKLSDNHSISSGMIHRFIDHIMNDDFLQQKLFDHSTVSFLLISFLFEGTSLFILKRVNSSPKFHAVLTNRPLPS